MSNKEKYIQIFISAFQVKETSLPTLNYQGVDSWDSIGHMNLIVEIEEVFNIMIDIEDVLDFNSYVKGFEILKKYNIEF